MRRGRQPLLGPREVKVNDKGEVCGIAFKRCTRTVDPVTGKFSPAYDESETVEVTADKLTYQISGPDIFVGGEVYTGPRFVIDAIAATSGQRPA